MGMWQEGHTWVKFQSVFLVGLLEVGIAGIGFDLKISVNTRKIGYCFERYHKVDYIHPGCRRTLFPGPFCRYGKGGWEWFRWSGVEELGRLIIGLKSSENQGWVISFFEERRNKNK